MKTFRQIYVQMSWVEYNPVLKFHTALSILMDICIHIYLAELKKVCSDSVYNSQYTTSGGRLTIKYVTKSHVRLYHAMSLIVTGFRYGMESLIFFIGICVYMYFQSINSRDACFGTEYV